MDQDFFLSAFLKLAMINAPAMIAVGIGIAATFLFGHRHPPAARRVLFALSWILLTYFLAITWYSIGHWFILGFPRGPNDEVPFLMILSGCEGLGYIFLLLALNTARIPYRPRQYYDDAREDDHPPPPPDRPQ